VETFHDLVADCVGLFELAAAGLMLADQRGGLRVLASSSEALHTLELFEVQAGQGPCLDCYTSGSPVVVEDEAEQARRWPLVAARCRTLGLGAAYALPLRQEGVVIGALNLFSRPDATLTEDDLVVAEALASVMATTILRSRTVRAAQELAEQLQTALNSRIAIEQAKGVIAATLDLDTQVAFDLLRDHARRTNRRLSELASDVATRRVAPSTLEPSE
jgi:GAF domain-containing protein